MEDKNQSFQDLLNNQSELEGQALKQGQENLEKLIGPRIFSNENQVEKISKNTSTEKSEYKKGLDYAIRLLSLRDYSTYKMEQKLKSRKIPKEDIVKVVAKLIELNYLREDEYRRQRIKQLLVKGYSNSYIIHKLSQEFLTSTNDEIDEIRTLNDLSSEKKLQYLVEKKLRGKVIPSEYESKMKLKNKITRFLVSKGHSFSEINLALKNYF